MNMMFSIKNEVLTNFIQVWNNVLLEIKFILNWHIKKISGYQLRYISSL